MLRAIITGALALLTVLLVTGCGGSSDSKSATDSASTQEPSATATSDRAADRAIALESTLTLEDFPSGWTQADEGQEPARVQCEQIEAAKAKTTARTNPPRFSAGENTAVQNSVYLFADESTAEQAFEQVSDKSTRFCYVEAVIQALKQRKDLEVGDTTSALLPLDPLGDQRNAARVTVPLTTAEGVDVDLVADMVFVRSDRGLSLGLFIDVVSPFDSDLREQLTATSVQRLSDNLGPG